MLKKNIYFILIVIFLISKNLFAYSIPNKKNSSIIDQVFEEDTYVIIINVTYRRACLTH